VRHADELLPEEEHTLAIFRNILQSLTNDDPWHLVMTRYVEQIATHVRGLGGDPDEIRPSPWGTDKPSQRTSCLRWAYRAGKVAALVAGALYVGRKLSRARMAGSQ